DIGVSRLWMLFQKGNRCHDLAGLAVPTLGDILGQPSLLNGVFRVRRKTFDRRDALVGHVADLDTAGADGLAIHMDGAGAALRDPAAEFRTGHPEFVANNPKQRRFRFDVQRIRLSVHCKCNHGALALSPPDRSPSAAGLNPATLTPRPAALLHR